MAAAAVVQVSLALDKPSVVAVAGPGGIAERFVVGGVLVGVLDDHGEGRPGGLALKDTGKDVDFVRLPPGGGEAVLAG